MPMKCQLPNAYETYRKQTVIVVQQDYQLDEWVTVNHMAVLIVIFDFIQSFRFQKGLMKGAHYLLDFVTSYVIEFVFDTDTFDDEVRKNFYDYDVKEIPLYENQEGYWRDLDLFESIWRMKPDIEGPETFSEPATPAMVHDTIACTPENTPGDFSSSGSLVTPPLSKCFARKKRKIDLNYEN